MTTTNKYLILTLAVIAGLGVVSCGPQKVTGSSSQNTSQSSVISTSNKPVASCSADVAGLSDLGVKLQTYSLSGIENTNWIRVKFTKFPTTFDNASQIAFWAYTSDSNGNNSTPQQAQFYVESINSMNQATRLSNDISSVTWSDLKNMAGTAGISATSASVALSSITFVVKLEGSLNYSQVIMPTLYLTGTTAGRYLSALIPKFYANPADYLASGKPNSLRALHPLQGMASGTWTADQYLAESLKNCIL